MMSRWQAKATADAAAARAAAAAAAESSRVALTMVRANGLAWSVEKDQQKAQLRRDWSTGTGESFADMMSRWQRKAVTDAAAAKACADGSGGGVVPGADAAAAPVVPPTAPGEEATSDGFLGLPIWAWGAGGAVVLLGGALVIRKMKSKKAVAA